MSLQVVVNGAAGRMGSTLVRLIGEDPELEVAGAVERPGSEGAIAGLGCVTGVDLGEVLDKSGAKVVVDFSSPDSTVHLAKVCAGKGVAAVMGTTGLDPGQQAALAEAAAKAPLFWAPNMSVGVNVLLSVLPELVKKLGPAYDLELVEIHHNKKKDAPSGTAIKLAQCVAEARGLDFAEAGRMCREGIIGARPKDEIGVQTLRGGDVVGEHSVYFFGPGERIEVKHMAHTREMFAQGALRACKWIVGQAPGKLYSMADIFAD